MDNNNITKKALITVAKRLKSSKGYKQGYRVKFPIPIYSALAKTIKNSFSPKFVLLISVLAEELNELEPPEITLKRVLDNLKIFLVVHISDRLDDVYCYCDSGTFSCDECSSGTITCDHCDGEGSLTFEDYDEVYECEQCSGSGELPCNYCGGEGYYECNDCNGRGYYDEGPYAEIKPYSFFTLDRESIDIYSDLALNIDDKKSKPKNAGNINVKNTHYFDILEDFDVNHENFGSGVINFEISEDYYGKSYVLGVFDLFDPKIILSINETYFMVDFDPRIESILETHFT